MSLSNPASSPLNHPKHVSTIALEESPPCHNLTELSPCFPTENDCHRESPIFRLLNPRSKS